EEEDCEHALRCGAQLQFIDAGFQPESGIDPNRPHQNSPAVTDVSTGCQQTILEWTIAESLGVWSDCERPRPGGLSLRGIARQSFGVFFIPRFKCFEITFQIVEKTHSSLT